MISLDQIRNFFPPAIQDNPAFRKYMLKEYIQLQVSISFQIQSISGNLSLSEEQICV